MTLKEFRDAFEKDILFQNRIFDLRDKLKTKSTKETKETKETEETEETKKTEETIKVLMSNYDFVIACLLGGTKEKTESGKIYDKKIANSTWASNCDRAVEKEGESPRKIPDNLNKYLADLSTDTSLEDIKDLLETGKIEVGATSYKFADKEGILKALKSIVGNKPAKDDNKGKGEFNDMNGSVTKKINSLIENNVKQIVLTGAPGTGKTYMAREIALENVLGKELYKEYKNLNKEKTSLIEGHIFGEDIEAAKLSDLGNSFTAAEIDKCKGRIGFVQFHSSYDYTDFVEGLRPVRDKKSTSISFALKDGIFMRFCNDARGREEKYFFIIDEINRADLSKVFGELMFGLEESYRDKPFKTQYSSLREQMNRKGKHVGFSIPKNVFIIGTMNDIDRSVETFDFALRRRFVWVDVVANDMINGSAKDYNPEESSLASMLKDILRPNYIEKLANSAIKLNNCITNNGSAFNLSEHYHLGHAYFGKINIAVPDDVNDEVYNGVYEAEKEKLWNFRIEPILREYTRGYKKDEIYSFIKECNTAFMSDEKQDVAK